MIKEILNKIEQFESFLDSPMVMGGCLIDKSIVKSRLKGIKQLLQAEDEYKWICDTCNRNCKMKKDLEPKAFKYCDIHQKYVNWQPINKKEEKHGRSVLISEYPELADAVMEKPIPPKVRIIKENGEVIQ